jgi:hypothetical protein
MSLSAEDAQRIADLVADRTQPRISVRKETNGDGGGMRRLIEGLSLAAIVALVAMVWKLSNNVSVLTTQVGYLMQEVQALRAPRQP